MADLVLKVAGSERNVVLKVSDEPDYLTDNPQRRCPDISQARTVLGFNPQVGLEQGLLRMLGWYRQFLALEKLAEGDVSEDDR